MKHAYFLLAVGITSISPFHAQNYVLTQRGDNQRTGSNTNETILTTSNVNNTSFGKLFSYPVDGQVYAQPLYVSGLKVAGKGIRNVLFIVTQHNTLYAFDADSLTAPLWMASLGPACPLPDPYFERNGPYTDIKVELGTTSTPVIDITSNTLYAVAFNKDNGNYYHRLYAIDISTGGIKLNSPVTIQATVAGTGAANVNGIVAFDSKNELQRTALILSNGIIYIIFASYGDSDPYHGWVLGYNAANLNQKYVFNSTPNGSRGGIWMSGQGPSVDANGDIYLTVANGDYTANNGGTEYGNSFLRLHPSTNTLSVADYFTPYNQDYLSTVDADLGVDAPIQIPNSNMLVGSGKEGIIYVIDRTNFGGYNTTSCFCDNQIIQSFPAYNGFLHGSVAYWDSNSSGYIYGWSNNDNLRAFKRNGNSFDPTPSSQSTFASPNIESGGVLAISSNGTNAGTGIVWANIPLSTDAGTGAIIGELCAFDATDVSIGLWNSNQNSNRDAVGNFAKFNTPTVVNGKVYQPTFSGLVHVYGLLSGTSVDTIIRNTDTFLKQNYPNPANENTTIEFGVSNPGKVVITLYQLDGRQIKTLFQGNSSGKMSIHVDLSTLTSGMYFYKMVSDYGIISKSLLILK